SFRRTDDAAFYAPPPLTREANPRRSQNCRWFSCSSASHMLYSNHSTRRTNRGRETMRDDPWTAANRDKGQLKVTKPPKRTQTAATASSPSKPTVSGPFWTGKKSAADVPKSRSAGDARQRTDD